MLLTYSVGLLIVLIISLRSCSIKTRTVFDQQLQVSEVSRIKRQNYHNETYSLRCQKP